MKHFYANLLSIFYVESILERFKEYMNKYITVVREAYRLEGRTDITYKSKSYILHFVMQKE